MVRAVVIRFHSFSIEFAATFLPSIIDTQMTFASVKQRRSMRSENEKKKQQ